MKVKIIRNTVAQREPVMIGKVLDLPKDEAKALIRLGKAVGLEKEEPETTELPPAENAMAGKKHK